MTTKTYIGLSVGLHNSVISLVNKEHRAEVIANEDGEHKTPTYLAYASGEEYHGTQALEQSIRNGTNTIVGFRNALGTSTSESLLTAKQGFAQMNQSTGHYQVNAEDAPQEISPHEAMMRFVKRLKTTAEAYVGGQVDGAVMAVPEWFTKDQRAAVAKACDGAGLHLLQIIGEPAAAVIQHGLGRDGQDLLALVVDAGGSGTDVSLVATSGGVLTVLGNARTEETSGDKLDLVLAKHFAEAFKKQCGVDISQNSKAQKKLKLAVETTKRTLSSATTAPCAVESLAEGLDFNSTINRTRFDILTSKEYSALADTIERVVKQAGYALEQIEEVLLCGGVARVRRLQRIVTNLFPESTEVRVEEAPEEVVAMGCAEQASLMAQGQIAVPENATEEAAVEAPVLSRVVGIRLSEAEMVPVLRKDTPLPASRAVKVSLPAGESRAYVAVAEGEPVVSEPKEEEEEEEEEDTPMEVTYRPTKLLAEMVLELSDVDENTRVDVGFFVGTDQKLVVTATEPVSGKTIKAEIPA